MKALKEKRIGLRSLWRRGLVILSLFALVFASCNTSGEDDTPPTVVTPSGPKPTAIEIVTKPTQASYEGLPVDLTGLEVLVRYDGSATNNKTIKASEGKFYTYPANAVGLIGQLSDSSGGSGTNSGKAVWVPMRNYTLFLDTGESLLQAELVIKSVEPITRSDTWTDVELNSDTWLYKDVTPDTEGNLFAWSKGLRLVGDLEQKIYVDDYPTFANYKLQAEYIKGKVKEIPLKPETDWKIRPNYENGRDTTGSGDLFVTIGKNAVITGREDAKSKLHPYAQAAYDYYGTTATVTGDSTDYTVVFPDLIAAGSPGEGLPDLPGRTVDPGLTVKHPYEAIWHVKSIKLVEDPGLDPYFYWESDAGTDWVKKLVKKGAEIEVTYTEGAPATKKFTVEAATQMNAVWVNHAPGQTTIEIPFGVKGIQASSLPTTAYPLGLPHARNRDPKITVYYRGQETTLAVPVYTRLMGIEAQFDGDNIPVDMKMTDNDRGAMDATAFSKKIKVVATFQAFSDPDKTAPYTLSFDPDFFVETTANQGVPVDFSTYSGDDDPEDLAVSYSMNFGVHKEFDWTIPPAGDWSTDGTKQGWGQCNNPRNNGREVAVVIYYKPPVVPAAGVANTSARNTRVPVLWNNIGVK